MKIPGVSAGCKATVHYSSFHCNFDFNKASRGPERTDVLKAHSSLSLFPARHSAVTQRSKSSKAIFADLSSFSSEDTWDDTGWLGKSSPETKVFPIKWGGAGFKLKNKHQSFAFSPKEGPSKTLEKLDFPVDVPGLVDEPMG